MRNLLLVDDDRDFLQLLSSMLQTDFQVYEATGMTEAIKIFEAVQDNAICSDFAMPDGTGIELLQRYAKQIYKSHSCSYRVMTTTALKIPL